MSLSNLDRHYMDQRYKLSQDESDLIDHCFDSLYKSARVFGVRAAGDDRAACLEAAFIRFVLESREG